MRRSILLVDDDQKTRLLLKTYLEKQQYEVHAAHDGGSFLSAFEILKENPWIASPASKFPLVNESNFKKSTSMFFITIDPTVLMSNCARRKVNLISSA